MRAKIDDTLWVGDLAETPYTEEFDVVITLSAKAGTVEDGIKHFHYPNAIRPEGADEFLDALMTLDAQWMDAERRTLVRCEGQSALVWPSFLVASLLNDHGYPAADAIAAACPNAAFMRDEHGAGPLKARLA